MPNREAIELDYIARAQGERFGGSISPFAALGGEGGVSPIDSPPPGSLPFDENGAANVGAVGASTPLLTFTVPQGYDGVIQFYFIGYIGGGFVDNSGDLQWQILADGRPIRNFSNILGLRGSSSTPRMIAGGGIRVFSNQVISVIVNHIANAGLAQNSQAALLGFYYPRKSNQ